MRYFLLFILQISLLFLLFCSKDTSNIQLTPSDKQNTVVFIDKRLDVPKIAAFQPNSREGLNIYGTITANELPKINYTILNDSDITNLLEYQYNMGKISFKNIFDVQIATDTFKIEINTSHNVSKGEIVLPEDISKVEFNEDTLSLGNSLSVTWDAVDADFYQVEMDYYYYDDSKRLVRNNLDTLLTFNYLLFKGDEFSYDGNIFIRIYPVNGPFPEVGAISNMDADGFLYSINTGSIDFIIVGNGLPLPLSPNKINQIEKNRFNNLILRSLK